MIRGWILGRQFRRAVADELSPQATFHCFMALAQRDHPEACRRLGLAYLFGQGTTVHAPSARHWMQKAADLGDGLAWNWLGRMCLDGIPGVDDAQLASLFTAPVVDRPNRAQALDYAWRGAQADDPEAWVLLAWILYGNGVNGTGTPEIDAKSETQQALHRAAGLGFPWAQTVLARQAADAQAAPEAVRHWLDQALAKDFPQAHHLAAALWDEGKVFPRDPDQIWHHLLRAAELGDRQAAYALGAALLYGRGCPPDIERGETWLRRSALAGNADAAAALGQWHGRDSPLPDRTQAARWYQEAIERGHIVARRQFAQISLEQQDFDIDSVKADAWLQQAAHQGDKEAWLALLHRLAAGEAQAHLEWAFARLAEEEKSGLPGRPAALAAQLRAAARIDDKVQDRQG